MWLALWGLTINVPITTSADNIFLLLIFFFFREIKFDKKMLYGYPLLSGPMSCVVCYHVYHEYWDRQALSYRIDLDQTPQNAASDRGLCCLPFMEQFFDTPTGSKMGVQVLDSWNKRVKFFQYLGSIQYILYVYLAAKIISSSIHLSLLWIKKMLFSIQKCLYFSYFSMKTYVVGTHEKRLD